MKTISYSEFKKLGKEGLEAVMPVIITHDGSPLGVFSSIGGVVVVQDLHPRMQNKIKALETIARMAMPKPEKVYAD